MDKNSNGYSLIELLVVVSIIILFSGLSLAAYNNFNEEKKLETETKKLIDVLNLASKRSASGDINDNSCNDFHGYVVKFDSTNAYRLVYCCAQFASGCNADSSLRNPQTYDTTPIEISTTYNTILFKRLFSGAQFVFTADPNPSFIRIKVKNPNLNPAKCIDVTIYSSGIVTEGNKYTVGC